jgi:hypothetical protein
MSLVYEALRKAEREKERKTVAPPAPAPSRPVATEKPVSQPVTPARRFPWGAIAGIVALAVLVAGVVIVLARQASTGGTRSVASMPPSATPVASAEQAPPPQPALITENDPRFKLTGIMGRPDGGFGAIINSRAVYEDNYIDGAIVRKIERNQVTLDLNGRDIVLRLN